MFAPKKNEESICSTLTRTSGKGLPAASVRRITASLLRFFSMRLIDLRRDDGIVPVIRVFRRLRESCLKRQRQCK